MINSDSDNIILAPAAKKDFDRIYSGMKESFIPEEIRDEDCARSLLDKDEYIIYNILYRNNAVGFMTVWKLSEYAFLEHFITYPEFRKRGYGRAALARLSEIYDKIVLECEHPIDEIQKRRFEFYKSCGFYPSDESYIQPSYRKGYDSVPLILMTYPKEEADTAHIIKELYERVYETEYEKNVSKKDPGAP